MLQRLLEPEINTAITAAAIDFALLPWTSAHLPSTVPHF